LLTIATFGGVAGLIKALLPGRPASLPSPNPSMAISWNGLAILLLPFGFAYALLLLPAAATYGIHDRYFLAPLVVALIFVVGVYQERVRFEIPFAGIFLVGASAAYSIVCTHHMFAFYRARTEMAAELHSAGVPDTAIDNGWEHNQGVELQIAGHLNYPLIQVPANVYTPVAAFAASSCPMSMFQYTPHVRPLYAISFDPDACYGLAPFAPIHYSRWPYAPGTLYVVRSLPPER
jgi:hypothetical protein